MPGMTTRSRPARPRPRSMPDLSEFDVYDRYDYDGDGNFDEPDGYIDTFQSVHAGPGEEAGAPAWAIWSHSWYAHYEGEGIWGPDFNPLGGIQVGDSDFWVGKYTIQPEDGGVGVFTHEYGHDLGLPDPLRHGRRRERDWVLDADVLGLVDRRRQGHRSATSRATWGRGRSSSSAGSTMKSPGPDRSPNTSSAHGVQHQAGAGRHRRPAAEARDGTHRRPLRGHPLLLQRARRNDLRSLMSKPFTLGAGATLTAKAILRHRGRV